MEKQRRYWVRWGREIIKVITGLMIAVVGAYLIGEGRFAPKPTPPSREDTTEKSFSPKKELERKDRTPNKTQEMTQPGEADALPELLLPVESSQTQQNKKSKLIISTPSQAQEMTQRNERHAPPGAPTPRETTPTPEGDRSKSVVSVPSPKSSTIAVPPRDFGNLLVALTSLKTISDNAVIVDLSFLNKTGKDIVAALDTYQLDIRSHKSGIFLTDNSGNKYELKESSGIGEKAMSQFQGGDKSGRWLICPPGVEMAVSLSFAHPRNMETRGDALSTSIPIVVGRFFKDNWGDDRFQLQHRFNIQFSNVSLK